MIRVNPPIKVKDSLIKVKTPIVRAYGTVQYSTVLLTYSSSSDDEESLPRTGIVTRIVIAKSAFCSSFLV